MRSLAALAFLALPLSAQTLEVPGDYADFQTALDAAPPNATVIVHGGHWCSLTVSKPVKIVGDPRPYVWGDGGGVLNPPMTLAGPGAGTVELENVEIGMQVIWSAFDVSAPAIRGGGFDQLIVRDSKIDGPVWDAYNYVFAGAHAIDVDVRRVWVQNSTVTGADTVASTNATHHPFSNPTPLGAPGGSGIVTTGDVILIDSVVRAGSGDPVIIYASPTCDFVCPGGDGGHGVVARNLYRVRSSVHAGGPSSWLSETTGVCCQGSPGLRTVVLNEYVLDPSRWNLAWPNRPTFR